ncbi:unnamed protein product [Parnassius apollo]|uniref:(apollo) hypothetical protein n=1 Tax=Parnassius apollo TaxID=110799 RepID=A0A8S3X7A1_PARAO|nr:unnamed protein product [Parnassius apollo]
MVEGSNETILTFLEYYQEEEILWNPEDKFCKDKKKIHDAWTKIDRILNVSIKDLKTKKETLMGTFRRHLKKKQDSMRSGAGSDEIYEPIWFAYRIMESFLLPVYTSRATLNTEETTSTSSESRDSQIPKQPFGDETIPEIHEAIHNERTDSEVMKTLQSPRTPTSQMQPTQEKNNHRRSVPNTAEQQIATAFGQLANVLGQRQSHSAIKEDDDCDLYAKLLAKKLRELFKHERSLIMYEIDGIFINRIQCRLPRRETPSPLYSNPYSRPPSVSTSCRSQPGLNIRMRNRPSSTLSSYSEPISNIYASNQPVEPSDQPTYIQCANDLSIQTPSFQSANAHLIQPSSDIYSVQSPYYVQSANKYSIQPAHTQSANTDSIQTKSNIIQIALTNSFETFGSNETSEP